MNAQQPPSAPQLSVPETAGFQGDASPLKGFQGFITPSGLSWTYRAGLAAVTVAMVLLPAVYVALIVFAAWGVYWHTTENLWIFDGGRGGLVQAIAYASPIVAGVTLVVFMVKPFFAKRGKPALRIPVQREAEPLLFEFVDRVCGLVGAASPTRIEVNCDVNASASFRKGLWSFFGNDLVLTIGLPLVAGLNVRQFAGVLAHEFGHFAQGGGMRLTYIIRQVNGWFARVVYERDQWDIKLEQTAKTIDFRIAIVLHAARGAVWLTRKILWALMHAGHAISCFMLRQMEFDADSYECKLAGSDTFAETTVRIQTLSVASHHAFGDLSDSWRSGRLPDNFAAFVQHKAAGFPAELRDRIQEELGKRKTGAFDTHPADGDRIKAAQVLDAPGVFRLEHPAVNLFADFGKLSKSVTREFYEKQYELPLTEGSLVSTDESVKASLENETLSQALNRYFFGVNSAIVPLKIAAWQHLPLPDWKASLDGLDAARQKASEMKDIVKTVEEHGQAEARWINNFIVCSLRRAHFTVNAKDFGVASNEIPQLEAALEMTGKQLRDLESVIQPFAEAMAARIAAALQLLNHEGLAIEALQPLKSSDNAALLEVWTGLSDVLRNLHEIRRRLPAFEILLQNRPNHQDPAKVDVAIVGMMNALRNDLNAIHGRLKDVPYPFAHASGRITVSQYGHGRGNYKHEIEEVYCEGQAAIDRLYSLYYKTAGRIASIAETIEERVKEFAKSG